MLLIFSGQKDGGRCFSAKIAVAFSPPFVLVLICMMVLVHVATVEIFQFRARTIEEDNNPNSIAMSCYQFSFGCL